MKKMKEKIAALIIVLLIGFASLGVYDMMDMLKDDDPPSMIVGAADVAGKIVTSAGLSYTATGGNLQLAINSLSGGGTVWVGKTITITTPIKLKDYVQVDFLGCRVVLGANINFLYISDCSFATVRNANVYLYKSQTAPVILLTSTSASTISYNIFENINMIHYNSGWVSDYGYSDHKFTGIKLDVNARAIFFNTFKDITMTGGNIGIHLDAASSSSYGNGNTFENIFINQFVTVVDFDGGGLTGFSRNIFDNVKSQTAKYSVNGFKDIHGNGNHFINCLVWDWYAATTTSGYEWSIVSTAIDTLIFSETVEVNDKGYYTKFLKSL